MDSAEDGKKLIADSLDNGKALHKFCEMLTAQGVKPDLAQELCTPGSDPFSILPLASQKMELVSDKSGIVSEIDALAIAKVLHELGAGRHHAGSKVDHGIGATLSVRVGQFVNVGDKWVTIHHNGNLVDSQLASLKEAFKIDENGGTVDLPVRSRIIDVIDGQRRPSVFVCQWKFTLWSFS